MLSKATASDTKQLWQLIRSTRSWSHVASDSSFARSGLALTANDLNTYFADIVTLNDNLRITLSQQGATLTMAINSSILDRFAKFFHCCNEQ